MVTTKSFTCATCEIEFDSAAGLGQHVAVAHKECSTCGEIFESYEKLDDHTRMVH